ncbi:3-oxoacyl-[acyl-carrier protein] reductase [Algoriphagus boseongensis]|uniref:3-oxoacyl-[acyl-carrier protein] reductase n=1 Tax=Algoriphagus boseongensis TaxID=1442587 RepID=A0A4V3D1V1_9BACT|nr:SDR family oxidoreductase [Algoriphagus boseongensis]TDQ14632.1 3-oxoacyl-[acyl-carrier protein] reductase [Algoriphagus boseongensis]
MNPTLILITGASSGIGFHLANYFEDQKIPLILLDIQEEAFKNHFSSQATTHWVVGDVANEESWKEVLDLAHKLQLPISHLINCAGVIRPGFSYEFDLSDISYHLDINTKGSILGTTLVGKEMKKQGFGHIINISSLAGLAPVTGLSLYVASKFAIRGFTLAVAAEMKKFGVIVSVVCPDLVNTPMLDLQLDYPEEAKLTFSGPKKALEPAQITEAIVKLMAKPKTQICIPEHRGFLAKFAGAFPEMAEILRNSLEKKGEKNLKNYKKH